MVKNAKFAEWGVRDALRLMRGEAIPDGDGRCFGLGDKHPKMVSSFVL
jgi:hypothetical protein